MPRGHKRDSVDDLVDAFVRWQPADDDDVGNLHLFLSVRGDYLGLDPFTWHEGDVEQLLLEVFPRKVQIDVSLLQDGPSVLRRYLRWLEATGRLRGSGIYQNEAELTEVAPQFAKAMNDPSRFGMAKAVSAGLPLDGLDLDDPQSAQGVMDAFNALPFEARKALTDAAVMPGSADPEAMALVDPVVLAPVRLADESELRQLAALAPLAVRVGELLAWVGPEGRLVTQTGALRVADAKALAPVCGDDDRVHRPQAWETSVRRMADLPGVTEAYELALEVGLLHVSGSRVRRVPALPAAGDALARVAALADEALAGGAFLGDPPPYVEWLVDLVDGELPGLLAFLYSTAPEPCALDEMVDDLVEELEVNDPGHDRTRLVRGFVERAFERFERLGVLSRLGVHVPEELALLGLTGEQATSVSITPLGVWWLQQALPVYGVRTPVVGELAALDAGGLCDRLGDYSEQDGDVEVQAWRAARSPEEAARQVAVLLADPDLARRQAALLLLEDLEGASAAVRPLLDDPAARPYARLWLETHGEAVATRYRSADDELLLLVESAAVLTKTDDPRDVLLSLTGLPDPVDVVRRLWRVQSPCTEEVLEAIAVSAPPIVSKAARKALFSLRSAGRGR